MAINVKNLNRMKKSNKRQFIYYSAAHRSGKKIYSGKRQNIVDSYLLFKFDFSACDR